MTTRAERRRMSPLQRLLSYVEHQENGCWRWTGGKQKDGYAVFNLNRRPVMAYRASYELLVGPIPAGHHLDHLCHTRDVSCTGGDSCPHRACVNPDHLEPVTPAENNRRVNGDGTVGTSAINARKTHCHKGHEFSEANTYRHNGSRICRTCQRASVARYQARIRITTEGAGR